jgi:hypothetical protein
MSGFTIIGLSWMMFVIFTPDSVDVMKEALDSYHDLQRSRAESRQLSADADMMAGDQDEAAAGSQNSIDRGATPRHSLSVRRYTVVPKPSN